MGSPLAVSGDGTLVASYNAGSAVVYNLVTGTTLSRATRTARITPASTSVRHRWAETVATSRSPASMIVYGKIYVGDGDVQRIR